MSIYSVNILSVGLSVKLQKRKDVKIWKRKFLVKLSLNAASCRLADSRFSVRKLIYLELKDLLQLRDNQLLKSTRSAEYTKTREKKLRIF